MFLGTIIFVITYSVDLSAGQSGTYFKACRQTEIRWRTWETIDGLHLTPRRAYVGGTTQKNMLLIPLLDPADVGGRHCPLHSERLISNQE